MRHFIFPSSPRLTGFRRLPVLRHLLPLLLFLLSAPGLAQENMIETIKASQQGSDVLLRISTQTPLSEVPPHFFIAEPARIVLDFNNTATATGQASRKLDLGVLKSYHVVQSEQRARMVLNVAREASYAPSLDRGDLVLRISPAAALPPGVTPDAERAMIGSIDFRRGEQNAGQIIVQLPSSSTRLAVKRQNDRLVADLFDVGLPPHLQRQLDVSDFGTAVRAVNIAAEGHDVRMQIEPQGRWEYHAYQRDKELLIEVRTLAETPAAANGEPQEFSGEKLSLDFQNIDVRAVLQVIADFSGINIITSDSVNGNVTLLLKSVPWDQALDLVMRSKNLAMRKSGNVMWIAPHEELITKERLELEQKSLIADLAPLRAEVFQLNYQKADVFRKVFGIGDDGGVSAERKHGILSKRGSAMVDQRTNQLFVTDNPTVLHNIRKLLDKIDIPSRQVLIEARIVEADDGFSRNLGVRLGFSGKTGRAAVGNSYNSVGEASGQTAASNTSYTSSQAVNLPAAAISGVNAASFALSLFNAGANRFLNLELSALEADGKGKIISSPRVVTADQQAALIEQGEELPYQQATSSGATATTFRKANLKLEVTPQITPDGKVILAVDVNKDSRGIDTRNGLAINTKHVKTQVQVENGGTVVIGGIYTQEHQTSVSKVPLLGDIPVLGALFRHTSRSDKKTELLIFLTPKIVGEYDLPH